MSKNVTVSVRMSLQEAARLEAKAESVRMNTSQYVRRLISDDGPVCPANCLMCNPTVIIGDGIETIRYDVDQEQS